MSQGKLASTGGVNVAVGDATAQQRALLIKFGSIGDVIMAIPGAAALHQQGFSVDWVVSEPLVPLLSLYPWIHVVPVNEYGLLRAGYSLRFRTWFQLLQKLRARVRHQGSYHLIATLYYDPRYRWLTALLTAGRRVSLSRTDRRLVLLPGRHHTDEYARILLDRPDQETAFQLSPVPPPAVPEFSRLPPQTRPRIVLVPAGARNVLRDDALRRWPVKNYVALAASLLEHGCEVILAGGPDDRWASAGFSHLADGPGSSSFSDSIGTLSLVETLSLFHSASVTVTHDTGPLHMAGLTATSIVAIFGPTDPHGRLPRRDDAVALWGGEGFACRPCYDGQEYAPCPENGCMSQVTPAMVLRQVLQQLKDRSEARRRPPAILLPDPAPFVQIRESVV